jgi:hypothetical protein
MAKKKKKTLPPALQIWIDIRNRYKLSHAHIQMARELGMNPKKMGQKANHDQEQWKAPLPEFIEHIYFKRFGREMPENIRSIEATFIAREKKREELKKRKQELKESTQQNNVS